MYGVKCMLYELEKTATASQLGCILQDPIFAARDPSSPINHDAVRDVMGNFQKGPTASASCLSRCDVASDCAQVAVLLAV
jgi:hypothetical protein